MNDAKSYLQRPELRLRIERIDHELEQRRDQEESVEETIRRPRLRRTLMPSARVLERRERQRALNERIRDTCYDRINGNFFPMEQIEE